MRPCPSYPGYFADVDGNVFSSNRKWADKKLRRLKPVLDRGGYLMCYPCVGGTRKGIRVHSLVLDAWVGPKPNKIMLQNCSRVEARHLDGNRKNNKPNNLCWGTHAENMRDRDVHGIWRPNRGEKNGQAKLCLQQVRQIRAEYRKRSHKSGLKYFAERFGVSLSQISSIICGKAWAAVEAAMKAKATP